MAEVIVAMVILGIISVIAVPNIVGTIQRIRLNGAAQKLASDIRYTRELALSRHGTFGIEFDTANNSYQLFQLNGATKTVITDPYRQGNMVIDFDTRPEFGGVTISSVSSCVGICATQELRINAFGKPLDASNAAFTSPATVTLQNGSLTRTIQVSQQTAFAELI